jgi:hypothetical protein
MHIYCKPSPVASKTKYGNTFCLFLKFFSFIDGVVSPVINLYFTLEYFHKFVSKFEMASEGIRGYGGKWSVKKSEAENLVSDSF